MRLTAAEVATWTGGTLADEGRGDVWVEGAATDSRELRPGQLFVPIVAARDGHDFIPAAQAAGSPLHLRADDTTRPGAEGPAVVVDDTGRALARLASHARERLPELVVGITGSVGKTSTKDLLAAVLSTTHRATASHRSHNNEIGVPLTLLNAPDGVEAVVVEMGARGPGHIDHLCRVARPTIGVVTTVGEAHTEQFGGLDAVVRAKGELIEALPGGGTAVLNLDVAEVAAMARRTESSVLHFGSTAAADVTAESVTLDEELRARFTLRSPWGSAPVRLAVAGAHQVANALAAAAAGLSAGVPVEAVAAGLAEGRLSPWRMELQRRPDGGTVLNDAYNANPTSMVAALEALAALPARRRVAALGTMAELGADSDAAHEAVAERAVALGIEVIAVGERAYGAGAVHVADRDEAVVAVGPLDDGVAVLVKASRVAGLERLAAALLSRP